MARSCPDCDGEMVKRKGQEMPEVNVDIVRHYCDPCRKVITTFEITTQNPLEDAQALLDQE